MNWSTKKSKRTFKNTWRRMKNENTMVHNLWGAAKVVQRGKFIAIQAHLREQEKSQINNVILHLKRKRRTNKTSNQ